MTPRMTVVITLKQIVNESLDNAFTGGYPEEVKRLPELVASDLMNYTDIPFLYPEATGEQIKALVEEWQKGKAGA